jgi:hypothetical protein
VSVDPFQVANQATVEDEMVKSIELALKELTNDKVMARYLPQTKQRMADLFDAAAEALDDERSMWREMTREPSRLCVACGDRVAERGNTKCPDCAAGEANRDTRYQGRHRK